MTLAFMDYDIARPAKCCAASGRELAPGEVIFSVLVSEAGQLKRLDYAAECWHGPPEGAVGWWRSRTPMPDESRRKLAPSEVLLELFRSLASDASQQPLRYLLALLLVRRRLLRLESSAFDPSGQEILQLTTSATQEQHQVAVQPPEQDRLREIEEQLSRLLFPDLPESRQAESSRSDSPRSSAPPLPHGPHRPG